MNKKIVCLALALMMICSASFAFATGSRTTSDLTSGTGVLGATDSNVLVEPVDLTPGAQALRDAIAAAVAGAPAAKFFTEDVQAKIAALLPAGFDLTTLEMLELVSVTISNYEEGAENIPWLFKFATAYPDGANVVAMFGVIDGATTTWFPLKAEVAGGEVKIAFTPEALIAGQGKDVVLAILSEKAVAK